MTRAVLYLITVTLSLFPPALAGQSVQPGKTVRVEAPAVLLERFEGVYLGRSGDTVLFGNDERGPVRVPLQAITRLDVSAGKSRLRGALRGAIWGGPIGLAATAIGNLDPPLAEPDTVKDLPLVEGLWAGAVTGAFIGVFVPKRVWRRADPRLLLTGAFSPDRRSVGARVAFSF